MAAIAMSQYLNENGWWLLAPMFPAILAGILGVLPYTEV